MKNMISGIFALTLVIPVSAAADDAALPTCADAGAAATSAPAPADNRAVLALAPAERALILEEMRAFLSGTQGMTDALARGDVKAVAQFARPLGKQATKNVPAALHAKLPPEFKKLGGSVHNDFDQIALDAESKGDAGHTLAQLSAALQKCVSCHAAFQIGTEAAAKQ